ncbi:tripartite tricarboxylate transporter substrate binding protein [Ramlibacter sp. G-1-2-2]|uniref:Tripartite tricarboxylate transporter substrate binding protein n=1 Tax=Ramlibacter agri TaxID=2728837 RepID=A0A848H383_9BURK|nr:tripartite tricarboxylate transporter substrate binding protein [Ramlibacter agri]NML43630.1 tripartite tricarboxylate transporter substrate binding protein [Ramlibacter agri]
MRSRLLFLSLSLAAVFAPLQAARAAWPEKPIRVIVPSAPGGAPDVLMRALTQQMSKQMGVPFVIDNKPGGSYVIGTMDVVRAPADGYTLAYGNVISLATNKSLLANVPYDAEKDLTLIGQAWRVNNFLVVNNNLPAKTLPELVSYAKQNPGKLTFASDGNGTTAHLGMELFKAMTGTNILHVPYKAATAGITDVIGGGVNMMMANIPAVVSHVQGGKLRALGISSLKRSPDYPQVPAIAETVPGFEVVSWGGLVGPAKMPPEIVERINSELHKALATPAVQQQFRTLGADAAPSSPEEFHQLARTETEKWAKVIKLSGAKVD